ncbi:MAG: DUF4255 domain-containing protein [Verrucomicrobiota bacterium]
MSNAFAIAAVSAALRGLLTRQLASAQSVGIVSSQASVTAQPPDRIDITSQTPPTRLNLFLYDVVPNPGLANEWLATHGTDGARLTNPVLALDLFYLISAFGSVDFETEILLGHAMLAMQESPGLSRAAIRRLLDPAPPDATGRLPRTFRTRAVELAEQTERITITHQPISNDAMSRIWSSLQGHYRPSATYRVSVVLLEGNRPTRTPFPVLSRGTTIHPDLLPSIPTLLAVEPPAGRTALLPTDVVRLLGHVLNGTGARVVLRQMTGVREIAVVIGNVAGSTETAFDLSTATPAGSMAAGSWQLSYEVTPPGASRARRTNELAVTLAPVVTWPATPTAGISVAAPGQLEMEFTVNPPLRAGQQVSVFVGGEEWPAFTVASDTSNPVLRGPLPAPMLAPGSRHLFRLRVDGAESETIRRPQTADPPGTPPGFEPTAEIVVP